MSTSQVQKILQEVHSDLLSDLQPSPHLLSYLLSNHCLELNEVHELSEVTSSQRRAMNLFHILTGRTTSIDLLITYLTEHQTSQPHLRNLLIETRDRVSADEYKSSKNTGDGKTY